MAKEAFIFDLDMTLVDSSPLDGFRRAGDWKKVFKHLDRVRPFRVADGKGVRPDAMPKILDADGHPVAVVTSSPDGYAKKILARFSIPYDVLVAYGDTTLHKPNPEPFLAAIERLGVDPGDTYCIGNDGMDVQAAHAAHCRTVGVAWGADDWRKLAGNAPDIFLHRPEILLDVELLDDRGYVGDLLARPPEWHEGSLIWLGPNFSFGCALGRYYPTGDTRHGSSPLSRSILNFKDSDSGAEEFVEPYADALARAGILGRFNYLVSVPLKPGEDYDRFGKLIELLAKAFNKRGAKISAISDGLECIRNYGSLKNLKPAERIAAVKDAFQTAYDWKNDRILLVDDVLTTGATTDECTKTLRAAGASEVMLIGLGKDQYPTDRKICPKCNRPMRLTERHRDGAKFWGCSGYWDKTDKCSHTEQYVA